MAAPASPISPYLARLEKTAQNLRSEGDEESRDQFHYETIISILKINSWHFAEILDLKVPITKEGVVASFKVLSNILSPEGKLGRRYEYAQLALDNVWDAARSFGVDMKQFGDLGGKPAPVEAYVNAGFPDYRCCDRDYPPTIYEYDTWRTPARREQKLRDSRVQWEHRPRRREEPRLDDNCYSGRPLKHYDPSDSEHYLGPRPD